MKVVLFCGGLGTRLREHSDTIPKPLVNIGNRPIMWHLMRYYAHFGHKDFILCLGYRGDMIREYFLNYNEWLTNNFVMSEGGRKIELEKSDIQDWRITFVDTGLHANIGQRLLRVREYLKGEEAFLANYADGLTDLPLDKHIADFQAKKAAASFIAVRTSQSFHCVHSDNGGVVTSFGQLAESEFWINAGFFCLRNDIFDYLEDGDELVEKPFQRLIERKLLAVYRYKGFWQQMDTFREKIAYDRMEARGNCPWMVWNKG
ncbi:glucose-1-phosphate cytidylyltransferase [Sulfuricaulis limicola]|uniref:Glucose-1-phosphate cytidylyltransferase n=1 Tax=Sulfuricaulis limicola TaxID=1620215 RepID=A0A1B4XGT5_9GAMM|nr:sugar phosphate nucleotidyltransferase [Sulfuricaulis limicola]BAV34026.1 glucose-1-phosphate cytidylyltransferase [Sulfuricaulis limicola]